MEIDHIITYTMIGFTKILPIEKCIIFLRHTVLILMYMPIYSTKMVLIDREIHELWALENEGLLLLQHKVCTLVVMCQVDTRPCNSHISSYEWKIWIITTRRLPGYVTLFFPYFSHPYFIKAMESHIGQHISQATEMQTLCWSKTRPSFSGAHNSYISWPINTIFAPRIGMYIRINIP